MPQSNKIDLRIFCEKLPIWLTISSEIRFSLKIFYMFEKEPCMAIYIVKMGVWNDSQTKWDSYQTWILMQKICFFYVSKTLLDLRAQARACVRIL